MTKTTATLAAGAGTHRLAYPSANRYLDDRPPPSATAEREYDVFTASQALERERLPPQTPVPVESSELFDPADEFLLDQPRDVADRLPCRVQDGDLWFAETPADLERAKAFCADCPAVTACLAGAISRREPWGVWGGEIFDHGVVVARKRPRGRPRKAEVAA